jgi:arabinan endo-1,5-alpha-L-arabinosidase
VIVNILAMSVTPRLVRRTTLAVAFLVAALVTGIVVLRAHNGGTPAAPAAAPTPTVVPGIPPEPRFVLGDDGVHDPTMVARPGGGYLLAHTGDNLRLLTSADLETFTDAGAVFPDGAAWTTGYTEGSTALWAPDISYHDGRYHLYYSASTFGSNHSAIFLATSTTGESGSWTNEGMVIESGRGSNFNAIDPHLYVEGPRWWLTFGSFWTGIKQVALDPATGRPSGAPSGLRAGVSGAALTALATRGDTAVEAPYLAKHGDHYYLWLSFGACCKGAASTYRTLVGRSDSPEGPFTDRNGTPMTAGGGTEILSGHGSVHGPGHPAILTTGDGDLLVYHYYADTGTPHLGLNDIGYDAEGWPFAY